MSIRTAIRKSVKWGGAALAVVLLVAWVGSDYGIWSLPNAGRHRFWISEGGIAWSADSQDVPLTRGSFSFGAIDLKFRWAFSYSEYPENAVLFIPLWAPLLLTLIPTGLAWRFDLIARRRSRRGTCMKCGYARSGLAAGAVCPECGTSQITA